MFSRITNTFKPRRFEDADKTHDAVLLHVILTHVIGLSIAGFIVSRLMFPDRTLLWLSPLLMAIIAIGLLFVARRGNLQLVSMILAATLLVVVTISVYGQGTVQGYHLAGYTLVLLITALLAPYRATLFFGGIIVVVLLGQFIDESTNFFTQIPPPESILEVSALLVLLALIILVLRISVERLSNSLRRANASEKRYRALVEMSPDVIAVHNAEQLLYLNPAGVTLIGAKMPEDVLGRPVMDFIHPDYQEVVQKRLQQLAQQPGPVGLIEEKFLRLDGQPVDVEATSVAIEFQGQPAIQTIIRDISERKRIREEIETYRDGLEELVLERTRELQERNDLLQQEIANRRQAERSLMEKRTHLQSVAEVAPIVLWALDQDGIFVLSEGKGLENLGLKTGEVLGQSVFDLYSNYPLVLDGVRRTLGGEEVEAIYEVGDAVFDTRLAPLLDDSGNVNGLVGASLSIGERVQAEKAQKEIEERFKTAFHTSPDSININRLSDGMFLDINQGFTKLTGYAEDDVLGKTSLEIDIWADPSDRQKLVEGLQASGEVRDLEAPFRLKDGTIRIGLMSAKIIRVGEEMCILSITRDIHHRKMAEEAIRRNEEKLRFITDNMLDMLSQMDANRIIQYVAPSIQRHMGYAPEDLIGTSALDLIHPDDVDKVLAIVRPAIAEKHGSLTIEYRYRHADGHYLWLESVVNLLYDERGQYTGAVFGTRDVTERKAAEDELRRHREHLEELVEERTNELAAANKELVRLSRVKDEFVSNVSHELRTPVTSMNLYHKLISEKSEKQDEYLIKLKREIDRLKILIEDLLRLSRLDQGQVHLIYEEIDLNKLISQYVDDRALMAHERNLTLLFEPGSDSLAVQADGGLISQAVSILMTNALTYTPKGGRIVLKTGLREENHARWAGFSVEDNGPGIAQDEQVNLFKRFFRGTAATQSGIQGTGLGLAIVKEIVDLHQGTIEVESTGISGEGSTFRVWLPMDGY